MRVSQYRRRESSHRSPRWSAVAIAAASLLLIQPAAHAAGFGALHVRSSLGQPLQAEIDLSGVTEEEAQNLVAKLASPDAYQRAGLTYNPIVSTLRASLVRQSGGSYVVRVISAQPVAEPFVDILVDLTWASGRVSRAYTFLLDPAGSSNTPRNFAPTPVVQATTPGVVDSTPAPVAAAPQAPAAAPRAARPARQAAARPQADATAAEPSSGAGYTVQRGDSLYDVASNAVQGQDGVSLDQMLLALYRNNPKAFIGGNINRLRTGSVLTVPSAAEAQKVSPREARREVVAQTSGFAGYRSRLATAAEANAATDTDSARQQSGSVSARVQDQATPSASERDELRLSKADRTGKAAATAGARAEELVAKEHALKEMESRVAQLEKNLSEMQHLIEVKNAELAKAAAAKPAAGAAPSPATAAPAVTAANAPAPSASASATPAQAPAAAASSAETASSATATAGASAPAAATPAAASAPVAEASAPAAAPRKAPVVVAPQPPAEEESFFSSLLGNPMALGLGGLVVALAGGLAVYRRRQQKPEQAHGFQDSLLSQESTVMAGANSLFGAAGGQSIDTSQHSVFGADFRIGGGNESNEVDPIAEADVYIAYGRDVQAEEILREALEQHPERQAIRLKLMEIYANRQDAHGFQTIAEEMLAQVGAASPDWAEAAALGRKFDPANPLYLTVQGDGHHEQVAADDRHGHAGGAVAAAGAALAGMGAVAAAAEAFKPTVTGETTRRGEEWTTVDPGMDPSMPSTKAPQLADLELPLESFPAPAAGEPITAPLQAAEVFQPLAEPEAPPALELPQTDFAGHAGEAFQPASVPPLHMDLSDLSLDLNPTAPVAETPAVEPAPAAVAADSLPAWAQPADLPETPVQLDAAPQPQEVIAQQEEPLTVMRLDTNLPHTLSAEGGIDGVRDLQIKFDLAKAYIEIGDKEGARELLQEVLDLGDPSFHAEAQALMRQIG
ncbi:FimV/HubP family polar landmark-like protein TapV [Ralstonia nicotianae]|uniref:FimV N-terminal domain-containing protein n=4 Tax=Ralstonia solanacearum species complex TaxID=3116862 RepID=A0A0S4U4C2_RALSL|nr:MULTISPECIES: FimV/HubP family polar landmark-like protein TapV [Ralstonia]AOE89907.1 60S ribosomal protein L22 [Ralstonia solanacearum]APF88719.1 peptidoglycan-binding protein [Ralstonia solanacearum FJAT-1458]ARS57967.1 peptidoglycan-binding protein [Ralstonia solanacearum FJAT-91]AST88086.1 peptidoglycan-binding protein [Ralstonia pseudosolanacearum]AXV71031.1 peptidoglycan-binding protein [Ralstonia solanacearum]